MSKRFASCSAGLATLLFCATLFAPAVSSASTGDLPLAQEGPCADIQVVFARGTGEPPGPGRVGQAFVDSLRTLAHGKSVTVYAVHYPASYEFLRAVDGANNARRFVEGTAASCPQTKLVLGGYSQGAAVVDLITVPGQCDVRVRRSVAGQRCRPRRSSGRLRQPFQPGRGPIDRTQSAVRLQGDRLMQRTGSGMLRRQRRGGASQLCRGWNALSGSAIRSSSARR
jgi:hypothetical protein